MLHQSPSPGSSLLFFQGDIVEFTLKLPEESAGKAYLRTNLEHADIHAKEICDVVENNGTFSYRSWHNIPMRKTDKGVYKVVVPLLDVGYFEAKTFFLPKDEHDPIWTVGPNVYVKIDPADYCSSNIIYNVFVRQFGVHKEDAFSPRKEEEKKLSLLDKKDYTVIPSSGTFRDISQELDFIVDTLGCKIILLLPIHPLPTVYARMGRFGSPFAALDFFSVEPGLAEFDRQKSPLEQFEELVDAIHERDAKLFLDIAINHTGWASKLMEEHPEWFVRDDNGVCCSPGAWGIVWEDLVKLDYQHRELWQYMADVFLTWCRRGVDGFRCDAGYKIPVEAWKYIVAKVRRIFPDTIFFLEGLGGPLETTTKLLSEANLNWAYSELFQNYHRWEVERYLELAWSISHQQGMMVHFAETHDNNRLASVSPVYSQMRCALSALASHNGGYGFTNGVEWFAKEKIQVHGDSALHWRGKPNQVAFLQRLAKLIHTHPAFQRGATIKLVHRGEGNAIAIFRHHPQHKKSILGLINLDWKQPSRICWQSSEIESNQDTFLELFSEKEIPISQSGQESYLILNPGEILCLEIRDIPGAEKEKKSMYVLHGASIHQRLCKKALEIFWVTKSRDKLEHIRPESLAEELRLNPIGYCQKYGIPSSGESKIVRWKWPDDTTREVMIPPSFFLHICAPWRFRIRFIRNDKLIRNEISLPDKNGQHFIIIPPLLPVPKQHTSVRMEITVYDQETGTKKVASHLLYLTDIENIKLQQSISGVTKADDFILLGVNNRGAMMVAHATWAKIVSRYDALLAANLNSDHPEDRWIMLSRCRIWVSVEGFSRDLHEEVPQQVIQLNENSALWYYVLECGSGTYVHFVIYLMIVPYYNSVRMYFYRLSAETSTVLPAKIIIRPDIEDRNFHDVTKAYLGVQHTWSSCIQKKDNGFCFSPSPERSLNLSITSGRYMEDPEWHYDVNRPLEENRGLESTSDLYSPGYFATILPENAPFTLAADIVTPHQKKPPTLSPPSEEEIIKLLEKKKGITLSQGIRKAMKQFIVNRSKQKTIIAGYPWFLDWGRDTLICVRGFVASGLLPTVRSILKTFAQFEVKGMLPNMIRGNDTRNRDTSDASLWFIVACSDVMKNEGNTSLLDLPCNQRTIREVILSIIYAYMDGTENGITMDQESKLIYSPSHFTWMDTNHPAGTPRSGYPIEIQALWAFALQTGIQFLGEKDFIPVLEKVRESIQRYFYLDDQGYFADCLHTSSHQESASSAVQDDALRCNQLLAITLGAVKKKSVEKSVLSACESLLIPGAIRSLANKSVRHALPIYHNEQLLNDPQHPYWGHYEGDEDTRRKPAYHNGTAWTWPFPSFCEAWYQVWGEEGRKTALAILGSSSQVIHQGCLLQVPEILDGNFPHTPRGCFAQAWGATEFYRVLNLLYPQKASRKKE